MPPVPPTPCGMKKASLIPARYHTHTHTHTHTQTHTHTTHTQMHALSRTHTNTNTFTLRNVRVYMRYGVNLSICVSMCVKAWIIRHHPIAELKHALEAIPELKHAGIYQRYACVYTYMATIFLLVKRPINMQICQGLACGVVYKNKNYLLVVPLQFTVLNFAWVI